MSSLNKNELIKMKILKKNKFFKKNTFLSDISKELFFNSTEESEKCEKICDEIIKLLENFENDIEENDIEFNGNKRQDYKLFRHEINYYEYLNLEDKTIIKIVSQLFSNEIKNYFDDINNDLRNIPISNILVTMTKGNNCDMIFFCKIK